MNAREQWDRVEAALDEILAVPEARWPEVCLRVAGDDDALLAEVQSLLACMGGADPILDRSVTEDVWATPEFTGLPAGTRVGAYRVIELIGRGGMGEVYRAERADGQYEHQVALKLVRSDLMDHPERFQAERQILAQLDHPGIARLLDGGVFEGRVPFMAIELVRGAPITEWCARNGSDLSTRLCLLIEACDAVAHAHASLVVHRDIKPGNVLVTDEGHIKLLDFGVAKLLSAAPADATRNAPMTPAYSAPEQLTGGAITTATDVYSLGMLSFELLCGELPWKSDGVPFGVAIRRILSETAPTPSRCARASRQSPVPWTQLRGDLDAVLGKALRKVPEHRYSTVSALREDLSRIQRHEPVAAREGARLYVIGRFVRRQRVLVTSAALLVIAILAGIAGVGWQAREALRQAQRAEIEGRKATAVKDFLLDIFRQSSVQNPGGVEARDVTAEQLLDVGASRIDTQLRDQPEVREELMDTLAELYDDLGITDRSASLADANLAEMRARTGGRPSPALAKLEVRLATALIDRDERANAKGHLRRALDILRAAGDLESVEAASASFQLGRAAYDGTKDEKTEGMRSLRLALDIMRRFDSANPLQGEVLASLARYAKLDEDYGGAERWLNELLAFQTAQGVARNGFAIGAAYLVLGDLQSLMQRYDDAERNLREAIALLSRAAGPDHPTTADARARLGEMLMYSGHRIDAAALLNDALQSQLRTPQGRDDATETRKALAALEFLRGRWSSAEGLLRLNLAQLKDDPDKELRYGITAGQLAGVLAVEGAVTEAHALYERSLDVYGRYIGERSLAYARDLNRGASVALAEGRPGEAAAIYNHVLEDWPATAVASDLHVAATLGLAAAELQTGAIEDARQRAGAVLQEVLDSPQRPQLVEREAQSRALLGEALLRAGRVGEAESQLREAVELRQSLDDADSPWLAMVRINLARCLISRHERAEPRILIKSAAAALSRQPLLNGAYRRELRAAETMLARLS